MSHFRPDPKRPPQPFDLNRLLLPLALLVLFLLVVLLVVSRRTQPGAQGTEAAATNAAGIVEEPSGDTAPPTESPEPPGLWLDTAIELDPSVATPVQLPEAFVRRGFAVLHVLPDGRIVLLNPISLAILDPRTAAAEIIHEAEFGLQAAANDRWIVYGEGGDEVFAVDACEIASGQRRRILESEAGYYGFELDAADHFYTTELVTQPGSSKPVAWLAVALSDGSIERREPACRRVADWELAKIWSGVPLGWSYVDGARWYRTAQSLASELYALALHRLDRSTEQFEWQLFAIPDRSREGQEALVAMTDLMTGIEPRLYVQNGLVAVHDTTFYLRPLERWFHLHGTGEEGDGEVCRVLALSPDATTLYIGSGDDNGLPTGLSALKLAANEP
ncbi:MAG: hypothetical protein QM270_02870 [Bacillota bacterium]|nr:hypothetical protein [Bacillota bacterium]